jgi:alpha-L-rhamnosidase
LDKCNLNDYAYKILTARGYPSWLDWIDGGATTLWEEWEIPEDSSISHNHHMYSCFMAWMIKSLGGIRLAEDSAAWDRVKISPCFGPLDFVRAHVDTPKGRIAVSWERRKTGIELAVDIPAGVEADYAGNKLPAGKSRFVIEAGLTEFG